MQEVGTTGGRHEQGRCARCFGQHRAITPRPLPRCVGVTRRRCRSSFAEASPPGVPLPRRSTGAGPEQDGGDRNPDDQNREDPMAQSDVPRSVRDQHAARAAVRAPACPPGNRSRAHSTRVTKKRCEIHVGEYGSAEAVSGGIGVAIDPWTSPLGRAFPTLGRRALNHRRVAA